MNITSLHKKLFNLNKRISDSKDEIYRLTKQYAKSACKFSIGTIVYRIDTKTKLYYKVLSVNYDVNTGEIIYRCNPINNGKLIKEISEKNLANSYLLESYFSDDIKLTQSERRIREKISKLQSKPYTNKQKCALIGISESTYYRNRLLH